MAVTIKLPSAIVGCVELQTQYIQPAHFVSRPMRERGFVAFASALLEHPKIVSSPSRKPASHASISTAVNADDSHIVSKPRRGKC